MLAASHRPALPLPVPPNSAWRLASHARPAWHEWDGEVVVHHALTNETHRLAHPAGKALAALAARRRPMPVADLARACGSDASAVEGLMRVLGALDLVDEC